MVTFSSVEISIYYNILSLSSKLKIIKSLFETFSAFTGCGISFFTSFEPPFNRRHEAAVAFDLLPWREWCGALRQEAAMLQLNTLKI